MVSMKRVVWGVCSGNYCGAGCWMRVVEVEMPDSTDL